MEKKKIFGKNEGGRSSILPLKLSFDMNFDICFFVTLFFSHPTCLQSKVIPY